MAKIALKNLNAGKRYKMVIKAKTSYGDIEAFPAINFTVPEAVVSPKHSGKLGIAKDTSTGTAILYLAIPENIMANLVWKDDVRDVVHIVYRTAPTKEDALDNARVYLISNATTVSKNSPIAMDDGSSTRTGFGHTMWTYGHPRVLSITPNTTNYYSFQFAVARYVKTNGTWSGKWISPAKSLNDLLSQQAAWGS